MLFGVVVIATEVKDVDNVGVPSVNNVEIVNSSRSNWRSVFAEEGEDGVSSRGEWLPAVVEEEGEVCGVMVGSSKSDFSNSKLSNRVKSPPNMF